MAVRYSLTTHAGEVTASLVSGEVVLQGDAAAVELIAARLCRAQGPRASFNPNATDEATLAYVMQSAELAVYTPRRLDA